MRIKVHALIHLFIRRKASYEQKELWIDFYRLHEDHHLQRIYCNSMYVYRNYLNNW